MLSLEKINGDKLIEILKSMLDVKIKALEDNMIKNSSKLQNLQNNLNKLEKNLDTIIKEENRTKSKSLRNKSATNIEKIETESVEIERYEGNCTDSINRMSLNLFKMIFVFLYPKEIFILACVSKKLFNATENVYYWKLFVPEKVYDNGRLKKMEFITRKIACRNFVNGKYQPFLLQGHSNKITSLHIDDENETVVSGSKDQSVKFWNLKNKKSATYCGHGALINNIFHWRDGVVSSSIDKTMHIWKPKTGEASVIRAHSAAILAMKPYDNYRVITGSSDGIIKFWDLEQAQLIKEFPKQVGAVQFFHCNSQYLASYGQNDLKINLWDLNTCQNLFDLPFSFNNTVSFNEISGIHVSIKNLVFAGQSGGGTL